MDTPLHIHVTGCHHSCAQHYIGDIGLAKHLSPTRSNGLAALPASIRETAAKYA